MSKSFEQEYRNLAQSELPDLWDRIEAGLTRKAVTENFTPTQTTAEPEMVVQKAAGIIETAPVQKEISSRGQDESQNRKKNVVISFFRRYEAAAAALLCVVILVPAFLVMRQIGMGGVKSESAMPAEEYAAAEAMREEAESAEAPAAMADMEFEAAENFEMEAAAEAAMDDAPAETVPEAEAVAKESVAEKLMTEEAPAETVTEITEDFASAEETKSESRNEVTAEKSEEGTTSVLAQIRVEITEAIPVKGEGAMEVLGGCLYRCVVTDAGECGEIGDLEEIIILLPKSFDKEFEEGDCAVLDLQKSVYLTYDYEVVKLYD